MSVKVIMTFAATLILLGIGMFFGTGASSPTALIPAAFGGLLLLTGSLARNQHFYWRATGATTAVAVIGGLSTIASLMTYSEVVGPTAVVAKVIMVGLFGGLLLFCFQAFWQKRQSRLSEA